MPSSQLKQRLCFVFSSNASLCKKSNVKTAKPTEQVKNTGLTIIWPSCRELLLYAYYRLPLYIPKIEEPARVQGTTRFTRVRVLLYLPIRVLAKDCAATG